MGEHTSNWRNEPWEVAVHPNDDLGFAVGFRTLQENGEPVWVMLADDLDERTAYLIAAAPDLLAALKDVVSLSDRKHNAWDKARAALAKAAPPPPAETVK